MVVALICLLSLAAQNDADVISSLRRALREARAGRREAVPPASIAGRRLQSDSSTQLCSSSDCLIDLTTGISHWTGAGITERDFHWAPVYKGSWIGDSNPATAPSLLAFRIAFSISEPNCASFDLAFAADGRVRAAQLNGRALTVPTHDFRTTTAEAGTAGLMAARGQGFFAYGTNTLVLTVANDAGALGLYVAGSVQLLCPLDEATVSMSPAHGPVDGGTVVLLQSNVQVRSTASINASHSIEGHAPLLQPEPKWHPREVERIHTSGIAPNIAPLRSWHQPALDMPLPLWTRTP